MVRVAVVAGRLDARPEAESQLTCRQCPGTPRSFSETWTWMVSILHGLRWAAAWFFSSMLAWKLSYIILIEG